MKKIGLTLILIVLALASCKEFPNPFEDKVIARADKATLRMSDIEKALPKGIGGEDSIRWVESYVDRWVRDCLKLHEATRIFGDDEDDITELVRNYRNSLLTRKLEQHYISKASSDSLYTENDLREYYAQHKNEFVLDRAMVKGRIISVPTSYRSKVRLKEIFHLYTPSSKQDIEALADKNGFVLCEIEQWSEFSAFLTMLPTRRNESYDELLTSGGVQEMTDGHLTYYFVITDYLKKGDATPYPMVKDMVKWAVSTRRKAEIVKQHEDSIYHVAIRERKAIINI
jgi:hypothetical protein